MKLTNKRLKEMIKEELLNEYTPTSDEVGSILVDIFKEVAGNIKKLNSVKVEKWGIKYHKSAKKLIEILKLLNQHITRIR